MNPGQSICKSLFSLTKCLISLDLNNNGNAPTYKAHLIRVTTYKASYLQVTS